LSFNHQLITPQAKIDSLQPVTEIMRKDRDGLYIPKVLMGSAVLIASHHV